MSGKFATIGRTELRKDAWEKVTGAAMYAADIPIEDAYIAHIVRSPYHFARIIHIDASKARSFPGVLTVLTIDDVPGSRLFGYLGIQDQPPLADGVARHLGEPVALVIGKTKAAASGGAELVDVEYEVLEPVFDPELAISDKAPKVHEKGNILVSYEIREGDTQAAFKNADIILEEQFSVPRIHPGYIEPENSLARWNGDGTLTVWVSSQMPFYDQSQVALVMGLPVEKVQVKSAVIGGAFGGKEDSSLAILAALGAQAVRGTVRIVNDRRDSFLAHPKRHAVKSWFRIGAKSDGTLLALEARAYLDTGAYASFGSGVGVINIETMGSAYCIPNVDLEARVVYTNSPYCGAMRGFGNPQSNFAIENLMDRLAEQLKMDPIDLRLANILRPGDKTYTRVEVGEEAISLVTCLERAREVRQKMMMKPPSPGKRCGVGLGLTLQTMGLGANVPDDSSHRLEWSPDGKVRVHLGAPDLGQGLESAAEQVTAQELGLSYEQVEAVPIDTWYSPNGGTTCASRMTFMAGNAIIEAAAMLKQQLLQQSARMMKVPVAELIYDHGMIILPGGEKVAAVDLVCRAADEGVAIQAESTFSFPYPEEKTPTHLPPGMPHIEYCFGCQVARVEVDPELGVVKVTDFAAVHDAGKVISEHGVEGQIDGGVASGIGYALYEAMSLKEDGRWIDSFSEYLLPTSKDMPTNYERIILEVPKPGGPYGAKGVGEVTLAPTAAAIAAAVFDATGTRVNKLPIRPQDVIRM